MKKSILVIDDAELMRDSITITLNRAGYTVTTAADPADGLRHFEKQQVDVVVTDLKMPGMSGIEVVQRIHATRPDVPVIMITAHATVETAVEAMKLGAFDYIKKPFEADELEIVVSRAIRHLNLVAENEYLKTRIGEEDDRCMIVGSSEPMRAVVAEIEKIAGSTATVLIQGESGTGKEVVARAIHAASPRKDKPFLCVNCAALSAGLLESELFGHEKGAFTGAETQRKGRFELADGGTLLLDEVSEIDPNLQAKLLRVLQERAFERVGSSETRKVDVRVLATTNRDLKSAVTQGAFREDLFYRLNVLPITLPPLAQRPEDIRALAKFFLAKHTGGQQAKQLTPEAVRCLEAYRWPGNVRELENIIERAIVLTDGATIDAKHLSCGLETNEGPSLALETQMSLDEMEKRLIRLTLERHNWHQVKTATALGIGERTLRDKMKKWGWQKRQKAPVDSAESAASGSWSEPNKQEECLA